MKQLRTGSIRKMLVIMQFKLLCLSMFPKDLITKLCKTVSFMLNGCETWSLALRAYTKRVSEQTAEENISAHKSGSN
jgi:hypothetical protein